MATARSIGRIGTWIRIIVGIAIITAALWFDYPRQGIGWWDLVAVLAVLPLLAVGAAWVVNAAYQRSPAAARRARAPWSAHQTGVALIVIGVVVTVSTAMTFLTPMNRIAILLFLGASMVLAAIRGYEGCEILALPNLVLRRTDAVCAPSTHPSTRPNNDPVIRRGSARNTRRTPTYAKPGGV